MVQVGVCAALGAYRKLGAMVAVRRALPWCLALGLTGCQAATPGAAGDGGDAPPFAHEFPDLPPAQDEDPAPTPRPNGSDSGDELTSGGSKIPDDPPSARFDVGWGPSPDGCQQVDLLFVIDNSSSMENEQAALVSSFEGFIEGIEEYLSDESDYHIGVTTTDANVNNATGCRGLGALVTDRAGEACGPYEEGNYMTSAEADLGASFECAASVGIAGDTEERPMAAALAALGTKSNATGACNAGFVRRDALLVLVLITDEDDDISPGEPAAWYEDIVALRGGDESNVVALTLTRIKKPNACAPTGSIFPDPVGERLIEFTERFTHGEVGDICRAGYDDFFNGALATFRSACDDFIPPG